jgi:hypothetical protein
MLADDSIQSLGGKARFAALSADERSKIAKKGAHALWSLPKATHEGVISLGVAGEISCAVLNDGTRLLTQMGFLSAIGRSPRARGGQGSSDEVIPFVAAKNLKPFVTRELLDATKTIRFRTLTGRTAIGYRAELLPKVCDVYLRARAEDRLHVKQTHIAKEADIIMRGLGEVGIVGLIDEATGYQYDRARNALAQILECFITKELQAWTKTFPLDFYQELFRLKNWPFNPRTMRGPRAIAQYTNDIVYRRLAPGVLDELRAKNPVVQGRRKHKLFQWLTGDIGHPKLLAHLEGVKILMKESPTWEEFLSKLDKYYPIIETTELGLVLQHLPQPKTNRLAAYNELMASLTPIR